MHVVRDMLVNEGPSSFFKGLGPAMVLSSYGVIQMYTYENVNKLLGYQSGQKMTGENFLIPFLTGGISKSIASLLLTPVNIVRLRLQMKHYTPEQVDEAGLRVEHNKN